MKRVFNVCWAVMCAVLFVFALACGSGSGEEPDPNQCTAGDSRADEDGCNTCTCQEDGSWACTEMACVDRCTPGESAPSADGCNTCTCGNSGLWICTKRACEPDPNAQCQTDSDCMVSGCSSQLCTPEPVFSTCEFLPEYACYRPPTTSCGCVNNSCGWAQTPELSTCVSNAGSQ